MTWGKTSREEFEERDITKGSPSFRSRVRGSGVVPLELLHFSWREAAGATVGAVKYTVSDPVGAVKHTAGATVCAVKHTAGATVGAVGGAVGAVGGVVVGAAGAATHMVGSLPVIVGNTLVYLPVACGDAVGGAVGAVGGAASAVLTFNSEFKLKMVLKLEAKYRGLIDEVTRVADRAFQDVHDEVFQEVYDEAFQEAFQAFNNRYSDAHKDGDPEAGVIQIKKDYEHSDPARTEEQQPARQQRVEQFRIAAAAANLTSAQALEIFKKRPSPCVGVYGSSALRFDASAVAQCAQLAARYGIEEEVVRQIWGRKAWISTTLPLWTQEERLQDTMARDFGSARETLSKRTPTHHKVVHLSLWAQKYLELEAELEAEEARENEEMARKHSDSLQPEAVVAEEEEQGLGTSKDEDGEGEETGEKDEEGPMAMMPPVWREKQSRESEEEEDDEQVEEPGEEEVLGEAAQASGGKSLRDGTEGDEAMRVVEAAWRTLSQQQRRDAMVLPYVHICVGAGG